MPGYDMECPHCGLRFEVFREGVLRDGDRRCIGCGKPADQRVAGFIGTPPPPREVPPPAPARSRWPKRRLRSP